MLDAFLTPLGALLGALGAFTTFYVTMWWSAITKSTPRESALELGTGFVTNFFDTLGIGSFAPTTAAFKFFKLVPDRLIPGTLNVGHTIPTIAEAFIYTAVIAVDPKTLILMIAAAVAGAYLGAGIVASWPKRKVQIGMGSALIVAAALFTYRNWSYVTGQPNLLSGSDLGTLDLQGVRLVIGLVGNFALGALMTLGIGMYAPCMILVGLLGMNAKSAFPIMMGSCAFLMPVSSARFVKKDAYLLRPAMALAIGGLPGVLIAAFIVKDMPLEYVRWLVIVVVLIAASMMLRSAVKHD
ncbi:MAG TPA: sulfite exporter TauE/SafE family protein [Vicinamibacterales bacterium]|nr:sulfite exporter TauE/SafE family protein [Vicinamibacterales bacterium]